MLHFMLICIPVIPGCTIAINLAPNFELWVEIFRHFRVTACFHMRIPKSCLSVCLSVPREKKSP